MAALASIRDYQYLTGQTPLAGEEAARIEYLLEAASGAVLAKAHDQLIEEATYEDVTIYNHEGVFHFPQRPVTAVASVEIDGVTLTVDEYRFTPGGNGRPAELIRRVNGADSHWGTGATFDGYTSTASSEAIVTYTAGWATIPPQIIAAVVATAKGVYQGSAASVVTETAGGSFQETYPSNTLALLAMKLPPATQKVIDDLCEVRGPTSVAIGRG